MTRFFCLILLLANGLLLAQSEVDQIRQAVQGYIVGTAYNYPDTVKSSFISGAQMFLDHNDKPIFVMTSDDYADRLAKRPPGQFNGRITNIISIEQSGAIATAKLEVIIPDMERRFIDLLLLKKLDNEWKILSKAAVGEPSKHQGERVLLVLSSARWQGDSDLPAGNSFSEVVVAYHNYRAAGYHVDIVSPLGGAVPLAYIQPEDELQQQYLYDRDFMFMLQHTYPPQSINPNDYSIVQFTGGSAPIFDVPQNKDIQRISMHVYEQNKGVIAAVCHGTAGLVNLRTTDGQYLVAGKRVNGFPDASERKDLPHYKQYPFIIEEVLKERGAIFNYGPKGEPFMQEDVRLVTGQNYQSSAMVTLQSIAISQTLKAEQLKK